MSEDDASAAILTPRQREYLHDPTTLGERGGRAARARIRDRVTASLTDAQLLQDSLDDTDVQKIATENPRPELAEGIRAMTAFLYQLADDAGIDPEKTIEDGMNRSRGERLDRILETLEAGDENTIITPDELKTLDDHGFLPEGGYSNLFKQWLGSGGQITVGAVREIRGNGEEE